MRPFLPSILCCAVFAACHDSSPPTALLERPTPGAPQLALITTGFTDLGNLGGNVVLAGGINDFGQIVASSSDSDGVYHAFLWQNGAASKLPTLNASLSTSVTDINNQGLIVGRNGPQAVVWDNGIPTPLGTLAGDSEASAINERGQIVGASRNAAGLFRAVLWVNGVPTDLGILDGDQSRATAINELGQIVGIAGNAANQPRPVLWVNGTPTDLGTLGGAGGGALGINDLGQIVGSSETATAGRVPRHLVAERHSYRSRHARRDGQSGQRHQPAGSDRRLQYRRRRRGPRRPLDGWIDLPARWSAGRRATCGPSRSTIWVRWLGTRAF